MAFNCMNILTAEMAVISNSSTIVKKLAACLVSDGASRHGDNIETVSLSSCLIWTKRT